MFQNVDSNSINHQGPVIIDNIISQCIGLLNPNACSSVDDHVLTDSLTGSSKLLQQPAISCPPMVLKLAVVSQC